MRQPGYGDRYDVMCHAPLALALPILGTIAGGVAGGTGLLTGLGIGTAVAGASAGALAGSVLGAGASALAKTPKAPAPPPVAPMPTLTNNGMEDLAKQQQASLIASGSGRMSTLLSQAPGDAGAKLGG